MEKTLINVQIPEKFRQSLLEAVEEIADEKKREMVATVIRATQFIPVECVSGKDEIVLKGPAQHVVHQIIH
jgi:hypothetical protein